MPKIFFGIKFDIKFKLIVLISSDKQKQRKIPKNMQTNPIRTSKNTFKTSFLNPENALSLLTYCRFQYPLSSKSSFASYQRTFSSFALSFFYLFDSFVMYLEVHFYKFSCSFVTFLNFHAKLFRLIRLTFPC